MIPNPVSGSAPTWRADLEVNANMETGISASLIFLDI
jgi:hypothetical protein